jgi:hypothetical protein
MFTDCEPMLCNYSIAAVNPRITGLLPLFASMMRVHHDSGRGGGVAGVHAAG